MSTGEDLNCESNYDIYFAKGLLNVASFAHFLYHIAIWTVCIMYIHTVMSIVLCMQFCAAFMKLCHSVQVFRVCNDRGKVPRFSVCHPLHCSEWARLTVGLGHVCTALATFATKVSYCHSTNTVVLSQPEGIYCNAVSCRYGIGSFAMRRILHTFGKSFSTPAQLEEVCWCLHPLTCSLFDFDWMYLMSV